MSVPDQNGMDGFKHDPHQQQQMYQQQHAGHEQHPHPQQYYGHYDHHQQNYAPVHHQGYNQQQQWYPQQQGGYQQGYQGGYQDQEHGYHHQIYDQMPLQQPSQHPHHSDMKIEAKNEPSWTNTDQNEATASGKDPLSTDEEINKKKSSPTKKVKKKIKVKQVKTSSNIHQKVIKVKKKDKKLTLTKEELTKYQDESLREVALKMKNGCDCPENCFKPFDVEMVYKHRLNIQDLTKTEHDMYIMGMTMACMGIPTERHDGKERKKQRAKYRFLGKEVCVNAFIYLENTTFYQIKSIRKHMMENGVSPRNHGNLGRIPHNTLSLDNYQFATRFLHAYFEKHAIKDKRQKQGIIKMPKNITCKTIHDAYQAYGTEVNEPSVRLMGYSSFRGFLREQFPNLKLDGTAVTPAKNNSTASNNVSSSTGVVTSIKIEENLNSLSQ